MQINIHELSAFLKEQGMEDYNVQIDRNLVIQFGVQNIVKLTGLPVEQVTEIVTQNPKQNTGSYTGKKRGRKSAAEKAAMEAAQGGGGSENGGFTIETPVISGEDFSDEPESEAESEAESELEAVAANSKASKKRR